jgi:hypothetical protein
MGATLAPTLAARDPNQRGIMWMHALDAWEPVVFERTGNRSLGIFPDAIQATQAWQDAMFYPADIKLPEGWTWDRVREQRARWGIGDEMLPEVTIPGACTAWGHVNWIRKHVPAMHA